MEISERNSILGNNTIPIFDPANTENIYYTHFGSDVEEDPSLADLPLREFLDRAVTTDRAQDLEYATMVMQESLRI